MKRKFIIAILCISTAVLTGCQAKEETPPPTISSSIEQGTAPASAEHLPSSQTLPESAPVISQEVKNLPLDGDSLQIALDGITNYEPGTAGSSLKVFIAAAELLNFTESYMASQETALTQAVTAYLDALEKQDLQNFTDNLESVEKNAADIIANDGPEVEEMLEAAGSPQKYEAYNLEKYEAVKAVIEKCVAGLEKE